MRGTKIRVGFAIDDEIIKERDFIINSSEYIQVSLSEMVDAILASFFTRQEKWWRRLENY